MWNIRLFDWIACTKLNTDAVHVACKLVISFSKMTASKAFAIFLCLSSVLASCSALQTANFQMKFFQQNSTIGYIVSDFLGLLVDEGELIFELLRHLHNDASTNTFENQIFIAV